MKSPSRLRVIIGPICRPGLIVSLCLVAAAGLRAADDFLLNAFDSETEASQWARWWGSALQTYEWDASVDADGNTTVLRYDADGRVTAMVDADGQTWSQQYDAVGNVTASVDANVYAASIVVGTLLGGMLIAPRVSHMLLSVELPFITRFNAGLSGSAENAPLVIPSTPALIT